MRNAELIAELRTKTDKQVRPNKKNILRGSMLCIDPGSTKLGYAHYVGGVLVNSGTLIARSRFPHQRLKQLAEELRAFPPVDVLVTEYIHEPNWKTVAKSYKGLIKSIGCIVSNTDWKYCIEVAPVLWQDVIGERFVKGTDEEDALWIGEAMMTLANGSK